MTRGFLHWRRQTHAFPQERIRVVNARPTLLARVANQRCVSPLPVSFARLVRAFLFLGPLMKFATRLKVTSTGTSAATLTMGSAVLGARTLAQCIADGSSDPTAIKVGDTGVPFGVEDGTGIWEESLFTITNATTITRDSVVSSSSGPGIAPTYSGAPLSVYSAPSGKFLRTVLTPADGVSPTDLTTGAPTTASVLTFTDAATGLTYKTTVAAILALASGSPSVVAPGQVTGLAAGAATDTTQVLNWTAPSTGTAPFTYKVERSPAGASTWTALNSSVSALTYTATGGVASTPYDYRVSAINSAGTGAVSATLTASTAAAPTVAPGQVTGLTAGTATDTTQALSWTALTGAATYTVEKSPAGANTWTTAATGVTGTSTTVTGLTPSTSYDYRVKGVNTAGTGTASTTVTKATIATATSTITVNNPGTVTAGTSYTASGTWTGVQPTGLEFQVADNGGTPSAWTAASAGLVINANGTWQFTATPSTASTSRMMSVRNAGNTSVVGTSTAYVVNAAAATMASQYLFTSTNSGSGSFTTAAMSGTSPNKYATPGNAVRVNIRSALTTSASYPANADVKFCWGKSTTTPPTTFASNTIPANSGNGNTLETNTTGISPVAHQGGWVDGTSGFFGTFYAANTMYAWGIPGTYYLWILFSDGSSKCYDNNTGTPVPFEAT